MTKKITRDINDDLNKLAVAFFENLKIFKCEYGSLGLDPKRPFGNSDADRDILNLIGWEPEGDDGSEPCFASWQRGYARSLYHDHLINFLQDKYLNENT